MKCCLLCLAAAVALAGRAEQLPIRTYTTADGLADNHINRIRQDSRGFLWFATDEGLTRFDGGEFVSYTTREGLPHPWVNDFLETRNGEYWVASNGGVSRLVPRHKAGEPMFVTYHPSQNPNAQRVNAILEGASGEIWCATYDGLYRLDRQGDSVKFVAVDLRMPAGFQASAINNLALDTEGALWLAARSGLYRRFPDGRVERYTERSGLPDEFVETLLHDHDGRWWIGTRVGGLCSLVRYPKPDLPLTEHCYSTKDGLPHNDVRTIFRASTGALWIGTIGGLSEFHPEAPPQARFKNYSARNGLSADQVYKLAEDRDGNLWIGTRTDGVMKFAPEGFVSFGERDGFQTGNLHATVIESSAGELCVATVLTGPNSHAFFQCLQGPRFKRVELNLPKATLKDPLVLRNAVEDHLGDWWVSTPRGLMQFSAVRRVEQLAGRRPKAIYTVEDGLPDNQVHRCYEDRSHDIWCSAGHEGVEHVVRLEHSTGTWIRYPAVERSEVTAFAQDAAGVLWASFGESENGSVFRYRGGQFEALPAPAKLFSGGVRAIYADQHGNLWVACAQTGLIRIREPGSDHPLIQQYTKVDGLASNGVFSVTGDDWGRIYAGFNKGVDRLDPRTGSVKHFTAADGLVPGAVEQAFRDRQGHLWFVTEQGISRLIPLAEPAPLPPAVLISGINIMGTGVAISELGESRVADLELSPGSDQISIDFMGLNLRAGATVRYQYQLEKANSKWSTPSSNRTVQFASLAPGSYRFLVRAITSDGASSRPVVVTFHVLRPIWRRWWFLVLVTFVFALAIYAAHLYHIQRILAVEGIRTRIAADLHDDIGASLSYIAQLGELARSEIARLNPTANAQRIMEPVSRISSISGELVDSMSDIVWAINPRRDGFNSLSQRMREFAEGALAPRDMEFHFSAADIPQERRLSGDIRRHLFLIFKECVNNVVHHSDARGVDCALRVEEGDLVLQLQDDGKGFEVANGLAGKGNGLSSIRQRAEAIGAKLDIVSGENRGVVVTLRVPLRHLDRHVLSPAEGHLNR